MEGSSSQSGSSSTNTAPEAHLYLKEAVILNPKKPVAYFICGEIYFRQNKYDEAIDNLNGSLECKAKLNNLYIIIGNSYLLRGYFIKAYTEATENYNIALKNDPNNYLCLKNCAYIYEKKGDDINALKMFDKLLSINKENSLILCYYGEILCNMTQYSKAILYFTKANTIDPENIHNLNKRAIAYYILQEYDKVLSDLDKIIQLDPFNNSAYYLKSLTYYTKNDIINAKISFNKFAIVLSNSGNSLDNIQLFHLEYLLNKNSFKDLNNTLSKINRNRNENNRKLLCFIRCKTYVELKRYYNAKSVLDTLLYFDASYIHLFQLLQEHSDFRSYLIETHKINNNLFTYTELKVINEFSKYMYEDCFIKFILNDEHKQKEQHMLKHEDVSKLEGFGWIEYKIPIYTDHENQLSIEINYVDMQIDYVRFGNNYKEITHIPNMNLMGYLLPDYHQICPNVPETFKDKFNQEYTEGVLVI
ncbi:TPR-like protein [Rhizophagus irregularis]|uniref:TPR-like protein n=1 Tax=Rhizophagus irregularis TaxID=588596 RepID=A0A2N0RUR0_9GLOM|nr:TPR-like protein [Rhizophagus irregularis]